MVHPPDALRRRKRQLLIPAALSLAGELYHSLAPGDIGRGMRHISVELGDGGKEAARVPRRAAEAGREDMRLYAHLPAGGGSSFAKLGHAAGDRRGHIGKSLGRLLCQAAPSRGREPQAIAPGNLLSHFRRGAVGVGRTRGNHIQRVADDIREHDGKHLGRSAELGKPTALHRGEALADGVHLGDLRAGGQELTSDLCQLRRCHQGLFKECRAAAGHQEEHRIPFPQGRHQVDGRLGGAIGVFIGHRVTCFKDC